MKLGLENKTVIVTGGGSGIGATLVHTLVSHGANVVSADVQHRAPLPQHAWAGMYEAELDVTDEEACNMLVREVVAVSGRLDILVNCAGVTEPGGKTIQQDAAQWRRVMDINLSGTYLMSKAAAAAMVELGAGGSIINVSSITGLVGFRASNGYGVSKAAVAMLTKTMAVDLAPRGIRVNAVAPGFINTPMTQNLESIGRLPRSDYLRRIPVGRFGETEEVVGPILMLCSDVSGYITGAVMPIDGGWTAFGGV